MDGRSGIPLVLLGAFILISGIAWGSALQKETFIGNQEGDDPNIGGDVTLLTGFLSGIGAAICVAALGRAPYWRRWIGALVTGFSFWFVLYLVQSAWPNYQVSQEIGAASIQLSNLLQESEAAPSVLLPVLSLGIMLLLGLAWAIRVAWYAKPEQSSLSQMRRDHLAVAGLAIPLLLITGAGLIRVMLELPPDAAASGLAVVIMPLGAAACALLAVNIVLRARLIANLRQHPDRAVDIEDKWLGLDRIDLAGIISLALVAILSAFLSNDPFPVTSSGRTFLLTPRSHGIGLMFLAITLVPLHLMHRALRRRLRPDIDQSQKPGGHAVGAAWAFTIAVAFSSLAAIFVTFTGRSALAPWVVGLVPTAFAVGWVARPISSALLRLIAAWTMWGQGNTIYAGYQANIWPNLVFGVEPAVLALWRMAAMTMVAWLVFDVVRELARREKARVAIPLSLAVAVAVGLIGLMEFPLHTWAEPSLQGHKVAVGSLLASQQYGVRVVMTLTSYIFGIGAATALARIVRPDWFRRRPNAVPAAASNPTPA